MTVVTPTDHPKSARNRRHKTFFSRLVVAGDGLLVQGCVPKDYYFVRSVPIYGTL